MPSRKKQSPPPIVRRKGATWEVTGEDKPKPPAWEREPLENGNTRHVEMVAPPRRSDGYQSPSARSVFTIEIRENCFVGGYHAAPNDIVECFADTAANLRCRGVILSEERNAV